MNKLSDTTTAFHIVLFNCENPSKRSYLGVNLTILECPTLSLIGQTALSWTRATRSSVSGFWISLSRFFPFKIFPFLTCLQQGSPAECLANDKRAAKWNLAELGNEENFDILDYIKAVNFLRTQPELMSRENFLAQREAWSSDQYLKPTNQNDPFLCHDWDSFAERETGVYFVCFVI